MKRALIVFFVFLVSSANAQNVGETHRAMHFVTQIGRPHRRPTTQSFKLDLAKRGHSQRMPNDRPSMAVPDQMVASSLGLHLL